MSDYLFMDEEQPMECNHQNIVGGICQGDNCGYNFGLVGLRDMYGKEIFEGARLLNPKTNKTYIMVFNPKWTWVLMDPETLDFFFANNEQETRQYILQEGL